MTLAYAILSFAFVSPQAATPQQNQQKTPATNPSGLSIEGKPVELKFPELPAPLDNAALLGWRGWSYLKGAPAKLPERYVVGYDWSPLRSVPVSNASAIPWHLRVVVFTHTERLDKTGSGVLLPRRHSLETNYLTQAQESIARLMTRVSLETKGQVRLVPEVTVERETIRDDQFGPFFLQRYLGPRINGGGYEAEDKVFRGPYQSAICIFPGGDDLQGSAAVINGTPVAGITFQPSRSAYAPGELDSRLLSTWRSQVGLRLLSRGFESANPAGPATPNVWTEASNPAEAPTDTLLERTKAHAPAMLDLASASTAVIRAGNSAVTEASLVTDTDRGQVLRISEKGVERNGGFAFPQRADGVALAKIADTPTLSFWLKTSAQDPIGVTILGPDGKTAWASLGRSGFGDPSSGELQVPLSNDGAWHQVSLDLRELGKRGGFDTVVGIAIEPTPAAVTNGRRFAEPIDVDFDDIRFTSETPSASLPALQPNATSAEAEERALFAAQATTTSPDLIALLADKSPLVRLNAAAAYVRISDNQAQPNLINDIVDLDPTVASYALRALMHQGGEIALTATSRTVRIGVTPLARATAAELLAETKDPKYAADIAPLLSHQSWLNRLAAVKALGQLPGRQASILRMALLEQVDPMIKVAITETSDPADEYQMRKLLWSAVNESSDVVRAASDIKLIQSPDATMRAEGYKGVRDDSKSTRLLVLDYLAQNPSEAHRGALRLAVTDRSAEVRAAAIRAFAALDKGAEAEEIANVLEDRNPDVQLALQELAKKRGFKLSEKTRTLMAESPDERVKSGLSGISG